MEVQVMDNKILEILLDMQKDLGDMKKDFGDMKKDLKEVNNRLDRIEFKMNDGFETLELLSENNSTELNKLKIKVSKLENRVKEMNITN